VPFFRRILQGLLTFPLCVKWDVLVRSRVLPLDNAWAARRRTLWWHRTQYRHSGPYQGEAWVGVMLESTEQDVVLPLGTVLCKALLEHVTGDEYNESQDDNTFLALFTFTDTTCNDTQPV